MSSGSSRKPSGIDGNVLRHTSSPRFWNSSEFPRSSNHINIKAQSGALDLPSVNGTGRITGYEATAQVSAARDRGQVQVGFDPLIDGAKPLWRERPSLWKSWCGGS